MITIFSIPKPFSGNIRTIQHNALSSWKNLDKDIEIILFGDELGNHEAADRYGARLIKDIEKNLWHSVAKFRFQNCRSQGKIQYALLCECRHFADSTISPGA